jgi:hypothetical protein
MRGSKSFRLIDYIEKFAKDSIATAKWTYVEIFNKSFFITVAQMKGNAKFYPSYLSNFDNIISKNSNLFILLGMRFCREASSKKMVEIILNNPYPLESPVFSSFFDRVLTTLLNDINSSLGKSFGASSLLQVNKIREGVMIMSWNYLNIAVTSGQLDKVLDELFLLKEIEIFKNRKDE